MVAAVTIQATAMWICGKDSAKKKAEVKSELYDCESVFHLDAILLEKRTYNAASDDEQA